MSIRIAIADDHPLVINGIRTMLDNTDIELIAGYPDGTSLLEGLKECVPDVLLLDIQMPGKTGEELIPVLQEFYPELRIIVLTGFDQIFYIKSMIYLGALGYLLKASDKPTMLSAIHTVYAYKEFIDPALKPDLEHAQQNRMPHIQKPMLTPREKEVLKLIAEGLNSQEIADRLFLGLRTIKNYRLSLLFKLDAKNSIILIKKAAEMRLV